MNANDCPFGHVVGLFQFDCSHPVRIKDLACTVNGVKMRILQRLIDALQGKGVALLERRQGVPRLTQFRLART